MVPGVVVRDRVDDAERASVVRVVAPDFSPVASLAQASEEDAAQVAGDVVGQVRVTLLGPDGHVVLLGATAHDLVAGQVIDVPLTGVPAGEYSVVVDADVPVLAGARVNDQAPDDVGSRFGTPSDFAWVPAAVGTVSAESSVGVPFVSATSAVVLPLGVDATLVATRLPGGVRRRRWCQSLMRFRMCMRVTSRVRVTSRGIRGLRRNRLRVRRGWLLLRRSLMCLCLMSRAGS